MYFGGVSALTPTHYLKMNGFPNNYWGWGGEDDDIGVRWEYSSLKDNKPSANCKKIIWTRHFDSVLNSIPLFQWKILSFNWHHEHPSYNHIVRKYIKGICYYQSMQTLLMTTSTRELDHFNRWRLIFASHLFRVSLAGMYITRPSLKIGRYKMIKHKLDKGNDVNPKRYNQMHLNLNSDKNALFLVIGDQNAVCLVSWL